MTRAYKKKLIEVALPLDAINKESAREKNIRHGHPSTLHLWWARRPLAAARAVIFAQMVDDPSAHPDLFPTDKAQEKERQRLFRIIEDLVLWDNTTNETVLQKARDEIWQSWRYTCAENADDPNAKEMFDRHKLPAFHDPFAGGGSLPLEAQRLGLESHASDLNPVAVLINKAMIEIPPKFAGNPPVNPEARKGSGSTSAAWKGAAGLAADVRYYGEWMREEAEKRIGHLYPLIEVTSELAKDRPDLKPLVGQSLTVIAWLWARTVKSPNPAFAEVDVPLVSSFMLSTKVGKEAYIEPKIEEGGYRFTVKVGKPRNDEVAKGTKLSRGANFACLMSGTPMSGDHIKAEGKAGRMGARMMAMVAESERGRVYIAPTQQMEAIALSAEPTWEPENELVGKCRDQLPLYGMDTFAQIFTSRQLVALTTFADLVQEARERVKRDALTTGLREDGESLASGGSGATSYADAVALYLGFCLDKASLTNTTQATWQKDPDRLTQGFGRQAIPMIWDYAEANPISDAGGGFGITAHAVAKVLERLPLAAYPGSAEQQDAGNPAGSGTARVVSTDPPYYDNICYADLSDYFYVWLRHALKPVFPDLFSTLAVPKAEELVATPYRYPSKQQAEAFFLGGMTRAMHWLAEHAHPAFPITIYYAFKQSEMEKEETSSTGWETFLEAVIQAGFTLTGTWPIRTELIGNLKKNMSALASSIVLVCRPRGPEASPTTRSQFVAALKTELPVALVHLQRGNIAPVDLAQAAIGPGMGVYTRYTQVIDAAGNPLSVRQALALINQVLDEALAQQEGDFDADSRWAITWFEQFGFSEGPAGEAILLSTAKGTALDALNRSGIIESGRGKVRLYRPRELPADWDPATDPRLTAWEMVHHLIRRLEANGEAAAAEIAAKLGSKAETARALCYRLYTLCERKKRATEALSYNGLVQSWPEITRLAREDGKRGGAQGALFESATE